MSSLAIGLMSGTSADGVDAALVHIDGATTLRLVAFESLPYASGDRTAILQALTRGTARELALLHVELGHRCADAAEAVLARAKVGARDLAFVALHGHTAWHEPARASLQLGDPAVVAERLGVTVVSDFRPRDIAAGGQGAPLVPIADVMLFGHPEHARVLLNIGGMANVTWVPQRGVADGVIAFDTGPGVAVIDAVARQLDPSAPYDVNGSRAARGRAFADVVERLLALDYFQRSPPKSTGRELFGDALAADLVRRVRACGGSGDDALMTAVRLTARSVALGIERFVPRSERLDVVVSGGGARNATLLEDLRAALGKLHLRLFEEEFFDGDAKEAAAFAYLGWLALAGKPGNVPSATGAKGERVLGRITPP